MPLFSVTYSAPKGVESILVEALTEENALKFSGVHPGRISKVNRAYMEEVRALFKERDTPLHLQSLVITSIANSLNSGGTLKEGLRDILSANLLKNTDPSLVERCTTASEFFSELGFHPSVVSAARAGEESDLSEALSDSAMYLQRLAKDKKEYGSKIKGGIVYVIVGLLFFLAAPLMMGGTLETFTSEDKIDLNLNIASFYLMGARSFLVSYFPFLVLALICIWFYRSAIFELIKSIPGFKGMHNLSTINRSIDFITNFTLLKNVGMTTSEISDLLFHTSQGRNREVYNELTQRLIRGEGIFTCIDNNEWPISVKLGLKKFDESNVDDRDKILNSILNSLYIEQTGAIETITSTSSKSGMFTCLFSILVMAIGFYLPLMGITSAIRG